MRMHDLIWSAYRKLDKPFLRKVFRAIAPKCFGLEGSIMISIPTHKVDFGGDDFSARFQCSKTGCLKVLYKVKLINNLVAQSLVEEKQRQFLYQVEEDRKGLAGDAICQKIAERSRGKEGRPFQLNEELQEYYELRRHLQESGA
jgi:hypothetical protein